jgi:hypothetical protein
MIRIRPLMRLLQLYRYPRNDTSGVSVWRYNMRVPVSDRQTGASSRHHRRGIYATETAGLLLIAFFLLVLIVIRYWHDIHWSLR